MNDQQNSQTSIPIDSLTVETEFEPDLGEASQIAPKTEIEQSIERQEKVEAGFKIVLDIRNGVIAQGAISQDEADRFQLLSIAPKAETILTRYLVVCKEIDDKHDSSEELVQLKAEQAELYLAYAYNTVALLESHYKKMMFDVISKASQQIEENSKPSQVLNDRLNSMLQIATLLEQFRSNSEKLVPELVKEYPQLQVACVALNSDLLKFLQQPNQLKDTTDQSTQELSRFVSNLEKTINVARIQRIQVILQEQAETQSRETSTLATSEWTETTTDPNLGGWVTDETKTTEQQLAINQTDGLGSWQSTDSSQAGRDVVYVDQANETSSVERVNDKDEVDAMLEEVTPQTNQPAK